MSNGDFSFPPSSGGGGDVEGPASSVAKALAFFDDTTGKSLAEADVYVGGGGNSLLQFDGTGAGNVQIGDSAYGSNGLVVLSGDGASPGHIDARHFLIAMPEDDAPYQLTGGMAIVTNTAAIEAVIGTLPATGTVPTGWSCYFVVTVAQDLVAKAVGSQVIRIGALASSAAGTATCGTIGAVLYLCYVGTNNWTALSVTGTWVLA